MNSNYPKLHVNIDVALNVTYRGQFLYDLQLLNQVLKKQICRVLGADTAVHHD